MFDTLFLLFALLLYYNDTFPGNFFQQQSICDLCWLINKQDLWMIKYGMFTKKYIKKYALCIHVISTNISITLRLTYTCPYWRIYLDIYYNKHGKFNYIEDPPRPDRDLSLRPLEPTLLVVSYHRANHSAIFARQRILLSMTNGP